MSYGIVITDKLMATKSGNIESMVHTANVENGMVVQLGTFATGQTEERNVVVPATASLMDETLLVAGVELIYDETTTKGLDDYVNVAGVPFRAFHLHAGDIFTISDSVITGTTTVGQFVIPANGSMKLSASATDAGTTRFVGKVIEKKTFGVRAIPVSTIQVVKA